MAASSVEELMHDIQLLGGAQYALVDRVRSLVKKAVPCSSESVKYGGILFFDGEQHFCGVFAYKNHVSVEFSDGARIDDSYGYLQGKGKGRRHLRLSGEDDIEDKQLSRYIPLAVAATREKLKDEG